MGYLTGPRCLLWGEEPIKPTDVRDDQSDSVAFICFAYLNFVIYPPLCVGAIVSCFPTYLRPWQEMVCLDAYA